MLNYIQGVRAELERVTWPTRQEVIRLTAIVIVVSVVVGIYLGAADFLFTKMLEYLVQ